MQFIAFFVMLNMFLAIIAKVLPSLAVTSFLSFSRSRVEFVERGARQRSGADLCMGVAVDVRRRHNEERRRPNGHRVPSRSFPVPDRPPSKAARAHTYALENRDGCRALQRNDGD